MAGFKLLLAVAKADGQLHPDERAALEAALLTVELPSSTDLDELFAEDVDIDAQIALLGTQDAKNEVYKSCYSLAHADGQCSAEEQALLEKLRDKLVVPKGEATLIGRVFAETKDIVLPSNIHPIADPEVRAREIREDIIRYSALSAAFGAFPVPGLAVASDLAVVALQVKLIRDIGQYFGHTVDGRAARSMLYALGFGTGARVAISNLVKFVPGYGSVFGATTSFAATFALGKLFEKFFETHRDFDAKNFDPSELKGEVKKAEAEGKKAYKENRAAVDRTAQAAKDRLDELNEELKAGDITQAEYEKRAAELL
jgi:uncharacterized protein (DUF697 family)/uncharacterized tellurite resistance protein B-like protein